MTVAELAAEPRISFVELARREGVALSTCWRWALRGCRGHRLESFNVGAKKFTTLPAYDRFLSAINGESATPAATPRQQEAAHARAERELAEMGI
jgi:hypothetical protein